MPSSTTSAPPLDDGPALVVERLGVRFGGAVVLRDLSFEVPRGTSLAIIGPNGAGKSVLFRALIGAVPHEGTIRWAKGARLGYVPQKLDLERDLPLTGRDFLRAKAHVSRAARGEVDLALETVGLSREIAERPASALSGGQFQRLLLAAALVGKPNVLLLDEPTAGVDEPGQESLNATLDRLRDEQGMTTLVISHDLSVVFARSDRVLCLSRAGSCFGPPKVVLTPSMLQDLYGTPVAFHVHHHGA